MDTHTRNCGINIPLLFSPLIFILKDGLTLLEKDDIFLLEAKVVVGLKELHGRAVGGARGHNVPRDDAVLELAGLLVLTRNVLETQDALSLELEEGLV